MASSGGQKTELSFILSTLVNSSLRTLKNVLKGEIQSLPSTNRKRLMLSFSQIRILTARILVLFRVSSRLSANFKGSEFKDVLRINQIISSLQETKMLFTKHNLHSEQPQNAESSSLVPSSSVPRPLSERKRVTDSYIYSYIAQNQIHKSFIRIIKRNTIAHVFPNVGTLFIKFYPNGLCKIMKLKLYVSTPKIRKTAIPVVKELFCKVWTFKYYESKQINKIFDDLKLAVLYDLFFYHVKNIKSYADEFKISMFRVNRKVWIIFPGYFIPFNTFSIEIISGGVYVCSSQPIYQPPESIHFNVSIDEVFAKNTTMDYCKEKKFFVRKLHQGLDYRKLLTQLRDTLFYSTCRSLLDYLSTTLYRLLPYPISFRFFNNGQTITNTKLEIGGVTNLAYIQLDPLTAEPSIECTFPTTKPIVSKELYSLLSELINEYHSFNVREILFQGRLFPFYQMSISEYILLSKSTIGLILSLSTNFLCHVRLTNQIPCIKIISIDGKMERYTHKFIVYSNLNRHDPDDATNSLLSIKVGIVLLEVYQLLKEKGYNVIETESSIFTSIKPLCFAIFKFNQNNYWTLKITSMLYFSNMFKPIIIEGTATSCRFAEYIVYLIQSIEKFFILHWHLSSSISSKSLSFNLYKENELFYSSMKGSDFLVDYGIPFNNCSVGFNENYYLFKQHNYISNSLFITIKDLPWVSNFDFIFSLPQYYFCFPSFIKGYTNTIQKLLFEFSKTNNWVVFYDFSPNELIFVYKRQITIQLQLRPRHMMFIRFATKGSSSFLIQPMKNANIQLNEKNGIYMARINIKQLLDVKMKLEKMYSIHESLYDAGIRHYRMIKDLFSGVTDDKNAGIQIGNNIIAVTIKNSKIGTRLSNHLARKGFSFAIQMKLTTFILKASQAAFGNTVLAVLSFLADEPIDWGQVLNKILISKEKCYIEIYFTNGLPTMSFYANDGFISSPITNKVTSISEIATQMEKSPNRVQTLQGMLM